MQSLAIKYRPKTWDDVTEQGSTKIILQQQLETGAFKHAYLFCGTAGCGKTTCARIFANEINKGEGNPIEMDAASNNSVDDVRNIIQQSRTKSLDSEYKIFIIDECHALSNSAWQAMLKVIEEPPAKSIFIFCTTDPQKIPKTIISRVQRFDFQRISQKGIVDRLDTILENERGEDDAHDIDAMEYIAKLADGGMRDAITMLDKCLSYNRDLTLKNAVTALGTIEYSDMFDLTTAVLAGDIKQTVEYVENMHNAGKDIKQFVKLYIQFLLDVMKYSCGCDWKYMQLPKLDEYVSYLASLRDVDFDMCNNLLDCMVKLNSEIKYSATAKYDLEVAILLEINRYDWTE